MAEFVHHEACLKCGSSDGKGVYSDGSSWCFVCHSHMRGNSLFRRDVSLPKQTRKLPTDLSYNYFPEAVEWFNKYGLSIQDVLGRDVQSSERTKSVYFLFKGAEGSLGEEEGKAKKDIPWQCRRFWGDIKYISSGDFEHCLPIYCGLEQHGPERVDHQHLVIVEDCLSAIKIVTEVPFLDAMPCLTSSLSPTRLKRLVGRFKRFWVWLDGNMFHNGQKMAEQLQMLGADARAVWTKDDPKCYDKETIVKVLDLEGKV